MKFTYRAKEVISAKIFRPDYVKSTLKRSANQLFEQSVETDIGYMFSIVYYAVDRETDEPVFEYAVSYAYLITEVKSADASIIEEIISDAFDRYVLDIKEFLKDHPLGVNPIPVDKNAEKFKPGFNEFISGIMN